MLAVIPRFRASAEKYRLMQTLQKSCEIYFVGRDSMGICILLSLPFRLVSFIATGQDLEFEVPAGLISETIKPIGEKTFELREESKNKCDGVPN